MGLRDRVRKADANAGQLLTSASLLITIAVGLAGLIGTHGGLTSADAAAAAITGVFRQPAYLATAITMGFAALAFVVMPGAVNARIDEHDYWPRAPSAPTRATAFLRDTAEAPST